DKYTAESIKNLKAVIAEAEKVYNSEEATQEQIDAQTKALEKAIDNLKNKEKKPESGSKTSGLDTADRAVETGDKTNLALPLVGGILAFVALAGMLVVRRKKK
ncbi:MAG: LPXTG cell wall anchor domain-containing protein, partial [[Ruminococcus] torques]